MSNSISLQAVIDEVKRELMSELDTTDNPLFIVEKVEVEVAVSITQEGKGGVSIQVLEVGGGISREQTNTIKVVLTPILSQAEVRDLLKTDVESSLKLRRASRALLKGGVGMTGQPE